MSRCVEELERVVTGWQPIATAPKTPLPNGEETQVLVCEGEIMYVAFWHDGCGLWMDPGIPGDHEDQRFNKPTHWMPLPEPPKE